MALLVLDRDGVINRDAPEHIRTPDAWEALPGSLEAIARLCAGGFTVAVASNQSGVGRGYFSPQTLQAITDKMQAQVAGAGGHLARVVYCTHHPDAGCPCRKPRPGLLNQLATIFSVATSDMVVVGDSMRDIEAARAAGATPVLVRTGNGAAVSADADALRGVVVMDDLASAADYLLADHRA